MENQLEFRPSNDVESTSLVTPLEAFNHRIKSAYIQQAEATKPTFIEIAEDKETRLLALKIGETSLKPIIKVKAEDRTIVIFPMRDPNRSDPKPQLAYNSIPLSSETDSVS